MRARLIALSGPLSGAALPLVDAEVSVGRDEKNDIALSDQTVSPRHCVIACQAGRVTIRDLDAGNPSFVNGLPAGDQPLADGDQIQIGGSVFELRFAASDEFTAVDSVRVEPGPPLARSTIVLSREDVFAPRLDAHASRSGQASSDERQSAARLARDLAALIRISAAINAVRGLVALQRPLVELIADVLPASRAAIVLSGETPTEIVATAGWTRNARTDDQVHVNRAIVERVLRDVVGLLTVGSAETARSVLAAPLVAFDKVIGAIVIETDAQERPFDEGDLRLLMAIAGVAATALEHARQVESLEDANRRLQAAVNLDHNMVGQSAAMRDVYRRIARVARTDSTVLITGESGTGKELVARAIHRNGARAEAPFIAINCAAITDTLLESELFGHEKGAFTGAIAQKRGKLELAEGGTVFLDEVGELSPALQAKLLRVLQDHEFERVGGIKRVHVDFRLIAATNRDLETSIESGAFRRDLFHRLNVVSLEMPPLRERRDDIPMLANWFVRRHGDATKRQVSGVSDEALACLMAYEWPGNVRELENAIEHAVVLGSEPLVVPDDLPDAVAEAASRPVAPGGSVELRFHETIKRAKKDLIARAVEESGGNYNAAARLLGLHPNYLHRLIKNLQMKAMLLK